MNDTTDTDPMRQFFLMVLLPLLVVSFCLSLVSNAHGQTHGFVESYNKVDGGKVTPQVNVLVYGPLKGKLGWSVWSLTSESYSEATVSLTYAPAKWIEASGGLGLETADNPIRYAGSLWMGKNKWSFLAIQEGGGSGYWYRYLGKYEVTKTFAVGINSTRFLGVGPYAEKKFGKVAIWATYAVDTKKSVIGLRFNF